LFFLPVPVCLFLLIAGGRGGSGWGGGWKELVGTRSFIEGEREEVKEAAVGFPSTERREERGKRRLYV